MKIFQNGVHQRVMYVKKKEAKCEVKRNSEVLLLSMQGLEYKNGNNTKRF